MGTEIERKFLATLPEDAENGVEISQGYLAESDNAICRIRTYGNIGYITIKSDTDDPAVTDEFEYEIPYDDACALLEKCKHKLSKVRYEYYNGDDLWTIDVFSDFDILILAEFEHEDYDRVKNVEIPSFVAREVTHDKEYSNYALSKR